MRVLIREKIKDIDVVTISIVENHTDKLKMFNCPTCTNPLFQYQARIVSILPGMVPTEVPIVIQCKNTSCKQKYLLKTVVSRQTFV